MDLPISEDLAEKLSSKRVQKQNLQYKVSTRIDSVSQKSVGATAGLKTGRCSHCHQQQSKCDICP